MEPRAMNSDELDLSLLFFRLRARWPLYVASLVVAGTLAFLYLKVKAPVYDFQSTMLLGNQSSGSKRAQELLNLLEVKDRGIKMEDEIGLIKSGGMVKQALQRLPQFMVSYYAVPNTWLNQLRDLQVRERPTGSVPFRVVPDMAAPQLSGTRVQVEVLPDGRYRLTAKGKKATLSSLPTGEMVREVLDFNLDQVVKAGEPLHHPLLSVTLLPEPGVPADGSERYSFNLNDLNTLTGDYAGRLAVRAIDHESRIIELSTKGTVPLKEEQFLDTLMSVFISADLHEKNLTGSKTVSFLDGEIAKLNRDRQQSAAALSTFRATRGVVDVGAQSSSGIQQLSNLEVERSRIESQRKFYETLLHTVRTSHDMSALSASGVNEPVLSSLILQLADLSNQKAGLVVNASDRNPLVTVLDERIRTTKTSLEQNLKSLIRSSDFQLADLTTQLSRIRGDMSRMPENERQLAVLKTKSDFNDKNYNFLIEKRAEAAIALATNATDKKVIDHAAMSGGGPSAPKPLFVMLIALLAGVFGPTGVALLLEKANQRIRSKEDLLRVTNIPMLGVVAHGTKHDREVMLTSPKGPIAESFRSIRVNLQYLSAGLDKKVLGVTSSVPGEGKTFCAVNLATELAHSGRRVALVETDLRRPTVAGYFELDPTAPGLADYLAGLNNLEECLRPSPVKRLDVLLCGEVPPNPTELLESPRMATLMERLRDEYDYVLLDTPPVGYVSEYFVLLRHLDANVYVVRQNYTDKALLSQIDELHREQKIKHVYIIINDVRFEKTYEYRHKQKAYAYGYS
ncbi:polysaccharide biosynthesis tyrosine autokinase [Hymenobacter busanensis]|uniref:non-specific protein-tyrosine kinase n=1 Tax=Hymenobacter busanensis TaxID=2607656 RepID=A0A7L4ZVV0_9BACT|nr:polysaccharide biosynthesis tyrosine autokinase [Hymenobacter busanensis]KAA9339262.1 polysaccharide biosynthesis tyrosine autokinase [Hymenobacter busanensis]QHJ06976.1 polysaccharide biosynthesis tyrosine autokinase [Hymenobacter busanensis]